MADILNSVLSMDFIKRAAFVGSVGGAGGAILGLYLRSRNKTEKGGWTEVFTDSFLWGFLASVIGEVAYQIFLNF